MATTFYKKTALTGGAASALDSIDGNSLLDGDIAFVFTGTLGYFYHLNATSGVAESSPDVISPDTNAGTKRWILQSLTLGTPASGDATNLTTDTAADNDSSTQLASTAFAKSQDAVLHRDPDQGAAMTAAASGGGIVVTDNNNIDNPTNNFFMEIKVLLPTYTPSATQHFFFKAAGARGYTFQITTAGNLQVTLYRGVGANFTSTVVVGLVAGTEHVFRADIVRETASVAGSITFSVDAVQLGTSVAITAEATETLDSTDTLKIMGDDGNVRFAGTIFYAIVGNLSGTAAEILDAYRNGIPESWKWGSQTELMPNQVDRDFSGASAWANVDLNAYDETGDLTITATAANQYCTCPVASAPTTIGKKYRMEFDVANIVSTWTIKSFDGTQTIGTVTANGTDTRIEWTATTTGGYRIVSDSTTSSGDFDNFSLVQIGATLLLSPESWQQDKPYDLSSNNLTCSYPASGWSLTRPPSARHIWPAVTAKTTAVTLTIAELLTLYITGTHAAGATQAYTLPTGALCDDWPAFETVKGFEWTLTNLSAAAVDTITLTADTGHTIVGNPIVQSAHSSTGGIYGNSARFLTLKTAADTFETRRLA